MQDLSARMAAQHLRLAEAEMAPFAEIVADLDRIVAWLASVELSYADEPAVHFAAPPELGARP